MGNRRAGTERYGALPVSLLTLAIGRNFICPDVLLGTELRLRGNIFRIPDERTPDGRRHIDYTLSAPVSGKVGLWSKTDSVSYFDEFTVSQSSQ